MSDWVIRDYVPEDEAMCVSMWLGSYALSHDAQTLGFWLAGEPGHAEGKSFRDMHRPIVMSLLRQATVSVACDPERVDHRPGRPSVVWAWLCASKGYVHWVGVKRDLVKVGGQDLAADVVRDLLGQRLDQEQRTTFELVDLWKLKLIPKNWTRDREWLNAIRVASQRRQDSLFRAVGRDVLEAA